MRINITKIKKTVGTTFPFSFNEEMEPLEVKDERFEFTKPVEVNVELTNTGGRFLHVSGTVEATLKGTCHRCLKDFEQEIKVKLEENYIPSSEIDSEQHQELEKEELTVVKGEELDLREKVIENLLLALPMKVLCRPDCKGICPKCGRNLNEESCNCSQEEVDPRLQILGKLFSE